MFASFPLPRLLIFSLLIYSIVTGNISHGAAKERQTNAEAKTAKAPGKTLNAVPVTFQDITGLPYSAPQSVRQYGPAPQHIAEYWQGSNDQPLIILIHGDCWLNQFDLSHIRPLASFLNAQQLNVLSIEYRRIGDQGGGWPGTFEDIKLAINYAATLDHDEIFIAGHSAGGHLALWAAASLPEPNLKGAIGLAAISDLVSYAKGNSPCQQATIQLLDGTPQEREDRYQSTSPLQLEFSRPVHLIHGEADSIVPRQQSDVFCGAMESCTASILPGLGHFDVIDPRQAAAPMLINQVKTWLTQ